MSARTEMVTIGNVLAAHASQFNYSEAADRAEIWDLTYPELLARLAAGESITGDCSSTYEAVCKWAGAPLGPLGYTGTELDDMPHIELADALQGDGIVFGAWPGKHVVWITKADPTNPSIDSHGQPGFQQTTLQAMWDAEFAGQPITVLSLAPFLPKPPPPKPSYHYDFYDDHVITLPHGRNSERAVVENYDKQVKHPVINHSSLLKIRENCAFLADRIRKDEIDGNDPDGKLFHRAFRLPRVQDRANGLLVKPS